MPPSNRRPLVDSSTDAPQAPDTHKAQDEPAQPAHAQPPTASTAVSSPGPPSFKQPCTLKGAASAMYAGALGYFLGVVPAAIKFKARQWGMIHSQGLASAQQLAVMSGVYTAVHCICQRIRMVEDAWNRGIAGCSTGLVLGWNNGPWSALQSCAGVGLISALIDLGGGVEAAEARMLQPLQQATHHQQQRQPWPQQTPQQDQQQDHVLASLPQPAQLLALMLGAPPSSMCSAVSSDGPAAAAEQDAHTRSSRNSKQQAQLGRADVPYPHQQHQQQLQQHLPQQSFAPAALLAHPAAVAVQQLVAAPAVMFLGACCQPSTTVAGPGAAAGIDGCPVGAASAGGAESRRR